MLPSLGVKVTYDAANVTAKVHFQSPEEYTLWVTASDDVMYFTLSWPNNAGMFAGSLSVPIAHIVLYTRPMSEGERSTQSLEIAIARFARRFAARVAGQRKRRPG